MCTESVAPRKKKVAELPKCRSQSVTEKMRWKENLQRSTSLTDSFVLPDWRTEVMLSQPTGLGLGYLGRLFWTLLTSCKTPLGSTKNPPSSLLSEFYLSAHWRPESSRPQPFAHTHNCLLSVRTYVYFTLFCTSKHKLSPALTRPLRSGFLNLLTPSVGRSVRQHALARTSPLSLRFNDGDVRTSRTSLKYLWRDVLITQVVNMIHGSYNAYLPDYTHARTHARAHKPFAAQWQNQFPESKAAEWLITSLIQAP